MYHRYPRIKLINTTGIYELLGHFWTRKLLKTLTQFFTAPKVISNMVI